MTDVIGCSWPGSAPTRKRKIVVFDSPDGTGKTQIAQALSMELKVPYFRMPTQHENWKKGKFKEALEHDQPMLLELIRQLKLDVVVDRAWPAEFVYSKVFKRETNPDVLRRIDDEFARLGAYVVIPVRHDYSKGKEDDLVRKETLPALHEAYMEFRRWTRCSTVTIYVDDYGNDLLKEVRALRDELDFGGQMHSAFNVTLSKERSERDLADLFAKGER